MPEPAARTTPGPHVQQSTRTTMPDPSETGSAVDSAYAELARTRKENADLKEALRTRTVIGQATGWLMSTLDLDPDEAFAELVRRSSYANRKVRDIAAEIVAGATAAAARDSSSPTDLPETLLQPADLRVNGVRTSGVHLESR